MQVGIDVESGTLLCWGDFLLMDNRLLRLSPLASDCESAGFGL
jgi:hypothetical protein